MKRNALPLIALICLLAAPHAARAKDTWTGVRSQNFFLVGDAPEKEIRQVAVRLEQFRYVFTQLFPRANFRTPVPTTVVVFKSDSAYKPFKPVVNGKPLEVAGYFQSGEDVNYITLTTERNGENPFSTIYHEYVHLLVNNTMGKAAAPPWFNEGLAEYYSTFDVDEDRKVYLGRLIDYHLLLLREQKLIPLDRLFSVDYYSLERNGHNVRSLFYAESWALVHYLILGDQGRRLPQMSAFVGLLGQGTPTDKAFAQAFQTDTATLEKELKDYIAGHTFGGQRVTFEHKLETDAEMQSAPVSEAEAEGYLGDLLLHINRPEDAASHLERALQLDPKLASARASLGMTRLRQNRFDDAKEQLRLAVEAGAQNYLAHYYYAYALSREGMDESGRVPGYTPEAARDARDSLRKAIELRPDFPESYHLLAFIDLVTGEQIDEAVRLIIRARALAPGNEHYALVLSQLYLRQEKYDLARAVVEPLTRDTSDPQLRAVARSILGTIQQVRERAERFKAERDAAQSGGEGAPRLTRRGDTDAPAGAAQTQSAAGDAASEEERVAEAMSSAINDALRKPLEGETRLVGTLARIECGAKGLVFVFKSGERTLRLTSRGFEGLQITAYTPKAGAELTCGARSVESPAIVTFHAAPDARAKTDGAIVALEFVPAGFKLRQ